MRRLAERRAATGLRRARRSQDPAPRLHAGASLITPNHHEAEVATHTRIRTDTDAARRGACVPRARRLDVGDDHARRARLRGSPRAPPRTAGARRTRRRSSPRPTSPPRRAEVADVTGAGDTVIALPSRSRSPRAPSLVQAAEARQPRRRRRASASSARPRSPPPNCLDARWAEAAPNDACAIPGPAVTSLAQVFAVLRCDAFPRASSVSARWGRDRQCSSYA